jgi:adenylate kinase family enzyme
MTLDNSNGTRFLLFGAPGAGSTTLARVLAKYLNIKHLDVDDYHWFTDDALPYRRRRNPEHRRQLLARDLDAADAWALSGALCGWGDVFIPRFQAVVHLWLPVEIRLARIRAREMARYGAERLAPGGDLHAVFEKFCAWAAAYDEDSGNIRSRLRELEWLGDLPCPTLRLESESNELELLEKIKAYFGLS